MSTALHAEWTKKLRTLAGPRWLLFSSIALIVAMGAVATLATSYETAGSGQDIIKLSLTRVLLGQAIIAVLAIQAISDEYGTGMIGAAKAACSRSSPTSWAIRASNDTLNKSRQ